MERVKNIIKSVLIITALVLMVCSVKTDNASAAVECQCTVLNPTKGCYADATGAQCAPEGTAQCWDYHQNCKKVNPD
jgi:hypothetical protein